MKKVLIFSKEKLLKLNDVISVCYKTNNIRLLRATQALIYIGSPDYNLSLTEIAHLLNVSRKTIYNWVSAFLTGGLNWLLNDPFHFSKRGAKARLSKEQKQILCDKIKEGPELKY